MKNSNETNMNPNSSNQILDTPMDRQAPAPTLMYLIELDPSVSTCLAGGSLPLQMLNVNQDNAHYLIPIQGADALEIPQYKHFHHYEETQAQPSVSSRDVSMEINTKDTNGKLQSNCTRTRDLDGCADTNNRPAVYGSHLESSKSDISSSEESFEQSRATTEGLSPASEGAQPHAASRIEIEQPPRKYLHLPDAVFPSRAVLSLPSALRLHRGRVAPRRPLPPARFGPVRGVARDVSSEEATELVSKAAAASKPVFLLSKGDSFCHIDVSDQEKSNWFSLLPLGAASANVWLEQRGAELFAVSARRLPPRAPLSLGYTAPLARALRLPPAMPVLQQAEEEQRAWCAECGGVLSAGTQHRCPQTQAYGSVRRRRRYRCKYCALPFARVFTLKRHVSLHCKSKVTNTPPEPPAPAQLSPSAADDERVPSDDSFHTFSGLEFSAALFGHDLPQLRDDSLLGPTHADTTTSTPDSNFSPLDYSKKVEKAAGLIKCPHCQLTMSSNMKQRHKRQCVSRGVSCACGARFRDRERLARHLRTDHAQAPHTHKVDTESSGSSYKCEQCQNTFKRRGMLVNHSWRVHGAALHVPLQRRQRHYPCGACHKLYRTAAKRDTHVGKHHPGLESARAACIESGAVACEPAACAACPRQYATRAKLLQHVRDKHPQLAPPSKSKPKQAQNELSLE